MDQIKRNYWTDFVMFVLVAITTITGLVLFFILPSGRRSGLQTFLDIAKETWVDVHTWVGLIFIIVAVIHLILHWKWIITMTKNLFKKK